MTRAISLTVDLAVAQNDAPPGCFSTEERRLCIRLLGPAHNQWLLRYGTTREIPIQSGKWNYVIAYGDLDPED